MLLAAGCSVDLPKNDGKTPLMGAAEANRAGTVKLLHEAGADKALVCNNGRTALRYAEQNENDAVAALLRDCRRCRRPTGRRMEKGDDRCHLYLA